MPLAPRDLEAIRSVIDRDADAVRRADWDTVTRLFTADAIRFAPHQAPIRGRSALRAWMDALPPIQQFAITADEIIGCDDFAFVRGAYVMTLSAGAGTAPQTDRGHYMGVLRKQPDGSWLWSSDMAVSELSPGGE
jgi:ketosteroid isomerase-like protein